MGLLKILAMIFGDLVCCVHFVVLLHSCTGALVAAPPASPVATPLARQSPGAPTNRSGRYTDTLPGELSEYCRTSQDCRQYAHVCDTRKQTCDCADGYRPDETSRACLGAVGRRCVYDSHCITNAYCKGQMICTCKREYGFLADDNWSCQDALLRCTCFIKSEASGHPTIAHNAHPLWKILKRIYSTYPLGCLLRFRYEPEADK
uniref:EB domain-containing protein n=1 Tax=Anopheles dirus TaxID=7168 RepID=A0A182NRZ9_9DIPT